ncbi:Mss4-like protein [Stachybotrys elegans]|uniref:Mss4-like protein n=1 Tax=Stachybotrys elegans TaxID=80388 RepID=A0A8K0SSU9_9HYPO|nr:Mss4-like protein [Stachybotrys elegans]
MEARCQCGSVRFTTPLPQPLALYVCHCSECRRQTGSAFGASAIFPRFSLPESAMLSCYSRPVASGHTLYCYFCSKCGTRLLHATPAKNVVSVKGGCLEGLDWTKAVHIWTKSAMVPIPESSESFSGDSGYVEYRETQEILDQPGEELSGSGGDSALEVQRLSGACDLSG